MDPATLQRDLDFYYQAVVLAQYSDYTTRVACIAAKGNKRICGATNKLRNPAFNVEYGEATLHAEQNVLRMLGDHDRVTLYIARLGKLDIDLPSRPCNMCLHAIFMGGFKEIVYLSKFKKIVKEKL